MPKKKTKLPAWRLKVTVWGQKSPQAGKYFFAFAAVSAVFLIFFSAGVRRRQRHAARHKGSEAADHRHREHAQPTLIKEARLGWTTEAAALMEAERRKSEEGRVKREE